MSEVAAILRCRPWGSKRRPLGNWHVDKLDICLCVRRDGSAPTQCSHGTAGWFFLSLFYQNLFDEISNEQISQNLNSLLTSLLFLSFFQRTVKSFTTVFTVSSELSWTQSSQCCLWTGRLDLEDYGICFSLSSSICSRINNLDICVGCQQRDLL